MINASMARMIIKYDMILKVTYTTAVLTEKNVVVH